MGVQGLAESLDNSLLHLILHPTERCNFRCTYCYERFDIGRMPPWVVDGVRRLIASRDDLSTLQIGWFGGEPLVAMPVIRQIARSAQAICADRGIAYGSDMTTNGYRLDLATLRECLDLGIDHFQISLDGDAADHDRTRVMASGQGTFETIWRNVAAALATPWSFRMVLRIHYHAGNLGSVHALIDRLCEAYEGEGRLSLFFKNVSPLGGPNDGAFPFLDRAHHAEARAGFLERLDGRLGTEGGAEGYICYACKPNSLIVRADGSLSKCTVALYDDHNKVGRLRPDGTLDLDGARMAPWLEALVRGDDEDRACPVSRVARGAQAQVAV